jgi:two-component system sensor histidine kinase AlgZ
MGVALRALLAANGLALLAVLARDPAWQGLPDRLVDIAMWVEPILIASLLLVCTARTWLDRLPYRMAFALALGALGVIALLFCGAIGQIVDYQVNPWHVVLWSMLVAAFVLHWLALTQQSREPALAEARLMAFTARIRPHFLFNSLNAVDANRKLSHG